MANQTTTLHVGLGVDTRDFARFAKALRVAAPLVRKELILNLRAVGQVVADEYRVNISAYSVTVPDSIRVRVSGATVSVIGGGAGVPMAALLEVGNSRTRGGDTFTHPVFGNKAVWANQVMHPALLPAVRSKIADVEVAAVEALDKAVNAAVTL